MWPMSVGAWAIGLLVPAALMAGPVAGDKTASEDLSARPPWLSEDQLMECATVLADGLRASELVRQQDAPLLLATPALEDRTGLPSSVPEALPRALTRLMALRTGCRVSFLDEPPAVQARPSSDGRSAVRSRLVVTMEDKGERMGIALYVQFPETREAKRVAEYVLEPQPRLESQSGKPASGAATDPVAGEYAHRLPINGGEIRFKTRKLAERLRLLADHTNRLADGRISVHVHLMAPDRDVKAKVRVEFLAEDGRLVHATPERKYRFTEGRPQILRAQSYSPAAVAIVYLDD